jgi:hypothetical protein
MFKSGVSIDDTSKTKYSQLNETGLPSYYNFFFRINELPKSKIKYSKEIKSEEVSI